jgi:hypothetical protein
MRHSPLYLAYVVEGTVANQFDGGALQLHAMGESWWESPGPVPRYCAERQRHRESTVVDCQSVRAVSHKPCASNEGRALKPTAFKQLGCVFINECAAN